MWKNISILGTFYRPSRIRCHKYGTFVAKIRMLEKLTAPGWKCQLVPPRCSSLSLHSKLKGRKRTFPQKGISRFISRKEKESFSTISHTLNFQFGNSRQEANTSSWVVMGRTEFWWNIWPATVWTLVRFVPAVDLPVPVQAARVGQLLAANLASHGGLPVRANLTGSEGRSGYDIVQLPQILSNYSLICVRRKQGLLISSIT